MAALFGCTGRIEEWTVKRPDGKVVTTNVAVMESSMDDEADADDELDDDDDFCPPSGIDGKYEPKMIDDGEGGKIPFPKFAAFWEWYQKKYLKEQSKKRLVEKEKSDD